jgi:hypothetical protein
MATSPIRRTPLIGLSSREHLERAPPGPVSIWGGAGRNLQVEAYATGPAARGGSKSAGVDGTARYPDGVRYPSQYSSSW